MSARAATRLRHYPLSSRHPPLPHPIPADLLSKSFSYTNKAEVKTTTATGVVFTAEATTSRPGVYNAKLAAFRVWVVGAPHQTPTRSYL